MRLILLFTVVPLVELLLLVQIGKVVGLLPTVALVVFTGALGAWLARLEGLRTLAAVQRDMAEGRMPTDRLIDGLLILLAAAVLLTPGLLTDTCGFLLLVPATRRLVRRKVAAAIGRRIRISHPGQPVVVDADVADADVVGADVVGADVVDADVIDAEWEREPDA
jgi:UPF0716 protein FxsA